MAKFTKHNLNGTELYLLQIVGEEGSGISKSEIQDKILENGGGDISDSTIYQALHRLSNKGFIGKTKDLRDVRRTFYVPTMKGYEALEFHKEFMDRGVDGMAPKEKREDGPFEVNNGRKIEIYETWEDVPIHIKAKYREAWGDDG